LIAGVCESCVCLGEGVGLMFTLLADRLSVNSDRLYKVRC